MRRHSILTLFGIVAMLASEQHRAKAQIRREYSLANAIVLFGAHWCAPCRGEFRDLPALAAAGAPDRLILAWVDRSLERPARELPGGVEVLDIEDAAAIAERIGGVGYGLPFSAMFDSAGRVCSVWRKTLHSQDIPMMQARCRQLY